MNNFEKHMQIIAGMDVSNDNKMQLSDTDKKRIGDAYFKLFYNLTYANWLRGGNLGTAWFRALKQLNEFIMKKNANNPAIMYLQQLFSSHNTRWSKEMMTNKNRDMELDLSFAEKQDFTQKSARGVNQALSALREIISVYEMSDVDKKHAPTAQKMSIATNIILTRVRKFQTVTR